MGIVISLYFELPCDFSRTYYDRNKISKFLLRILPYACASFQTLVTKNSKGYNSPWDSPPHPTPHRISYIITLHIAHVAVDHVVI